MILTFPYYDPDGRYSQSFRRQLDTLESTFDAICVSAIPPTLENNAEIARLLERRGCCVFNNAPGSPVGDHARTALRLAADQAQAGQPIFFGFLNRFLFALETEWRERFLRDIETHQAAQFLIFERSEAAWNTHPSNYREIEQMVSRIFELFSGKFVELMPCGLIQSPAVARAVLSESTAQSWEVWAEWTFLAMRDGIPVTTQKVDWLAYQHPYWEQVDPEAMKRARENSYQEVVKRIQMNVPVTALMIEERFRAWLEAS